MEFLVNIKIKWPEGMDPAEIERISVEEREMAKILRAERKMLRMWRVPARRENWGLWQADDATHLHQIISALPVWPYMDVNVLPLAYHPVDPRPHDEADVNA
ncbi:hypothetical protein MASR1M32_03500 [Rhodobacter sp.]